jgi:SAM-dependent methyltransferase
MELRKQKEIEYYDKQAQKWAGRGDFEGFDPSLLSSYSFCYHWLKDNCQGKKVLDYGCGNGIHSVSLAKWGAEVVGIDLSEPLIEIAKRRAQKEGVNVNFLVMDCESTEFPDNSFDIIFDGGTFSSLDIRKAFPELSRILKKDGFLLGIETLGHNPFANINRKINKKKGKRTEWAADHIIQIRDLEYAKNFFDNTDIKFFHLISWTAFPLLKIPGSKSVLKLLEAGDKELLKIPFLKKYAFKTVFIFQKYGQKNI